jgi:hypothetical protein
MADDDLQIQPCREDEEDDDPDEFVLAVFVVRFDTNVGNIVEWTYPESHYYVVS